jgi:hypothetical protein
MIMACPSCLHLLVISWRSIHPTLARILSMCPLTSLIMKISINDIAHQVSKCCPIKSCQVIIQAQELLEKVCIGLIALHFARPIFDKLILIIIAYIYFLQLAFLIPQL